MFLNESSFFRYNGVCLGLFVAFVALVKAGRFVPAAVAFCLALNFKHIALYYAVPVFLHLLRACLAPLHVTRFFSIALAVVITFGVLWAPFVMNGTAYNVVERMLPFGRGIYEVSELEMDVSNFCPEHFGTLIRQRKTQCSALM